MNNRKNYWLIAIVLFGFAFRVIIAMVVDPTKLLGDPQEYQGYAENLLNHHRYFFDHGFSPDTGLSPVELYSARAPGYPFFLVLIFLLFGAHVRAVLLVQAVTDTLSTFLVYPFARKFVGRNYALIATAAYATVPGWYMLVLTEGLTVLLFLGLCLGAFNIAQRPTRFKFFLHGLMLGYAVLVHPDAILYAPVFLGYLFWKKALTRNWSGVMLWGIAIAAVVAPWLVREYKVHHQFVWIASIGGRTIYDGLYKKPYDIPTVTAAARKRGITDEVDVDKIFVRLSWIWIWAHPGYYALTVGQRLHKLFSFHAYRYTKGWLMAPILDVPGPWGHALAFFFYYCLLLGRCVVIIALAGVAISFRRLRAQPELLLVNIPVLLVVVLHSLVFEGDARYFAAVYPSVCAGFVLGLEWGRKLLPNGQRMNGKINPAS